MDYQLLILGAGPAGYESALRAAQLGMRVALVERADVGGVCLNRGCIPTKTFLHQAARQMDFAALDARKREVVGTLRGGIEALLSKRGVTLIRGEGVLQDAHTLKVGESAITAEHLLIATGSRPALPPIEGIELALTSDDVLNNPRPLRSIVILGGGVIGVELGSFYAATGATVTIVEARERLLPLLDRELSQSLQMALREQGVQVLCRARAERVAREGESVALHLADGQRLSAQALLVATGRRPNTEGLCAPGIELAMERGFLTVNERFETSLPGVYAVGDVIGGQMLAHAATAQGLAVVHRLAGEEPPLALEAIPSCVYTTPEIATVGLTLADCRARGIAAKSAKALMGGNGRTLIAGGRRGYVRVVVAEADGRVLGAQLMCERATDMVDTFTVAIANGLTARQLSRAIRPHPTFVEAIGEALDALEGRALHQM